MLSLQVLHFHGPSGLPGNVTENYSLELAKLRAEGAKRKDEMPEMKEKLQMLDRLIRRKPVKKVVCG